MQAEKCKDTHTPNTFTVTLYVQAFHSREHLEQSELFQASAKDTPDYRRTHVVTGTDAQTHTHTMETKIFKNSLKRKTNPKMQKKKKKN